MKTTKLPKTQTGISIIEIMIALLIGLFLLGGLIQMFITSKQTYKVQDAMSRLQENGRFAMDFLVRDIRSAGSWGCFSNTVNVIPLLNKGTAIFDGYAAGIEGEETTSTNKDVLPKTDTLTLRNSIPLLDADGADVVIKKIPSSTSADLQISANSGIVKGDIIFVSDCGVGNLFQVTGNNTGKDFDNITHQTGTEKPGNASKEFSKVYGPDARVYKASFFSYQIRVGDSGQPALFRVNGMGIGNDTQELIEGVENMQILYGEDTDGNGVPNRYTTADKVNMPQVVSLQISLLVRSLEDNLTGIPISYTFNGETVTPTDTRIRRVFSSVITVRNRLV
jgi:type IV pilus assembly protein PilW